MIQKSYEKDIGVLYLVPTPIGNLKDITNRAIEVLSKVDIIFAEDTRVTKQLLKFLNIKNEVVACHKFNESKMMKVAIELLNDGNNIALVTDRGTPLISDPGSLVVSEVIKNNYSVVALPGACAFVPALAMSNISADKFLFYGFLNSKDSQAIIELEMLKNINFTIVLYEAPHRLIKTLQNIYKVLGNRIISISREISKLHEEVYRGDVIGALKFYNNPIGEFVIVIQKNESNYIVDYDKYVIEVKRLIELGLKSNDAIKEVAKNNEISKNKLYEFYQRSKK